MGKGGSSSSSSSATTNQTINEDNRVASDAQGSIALGKDAALQINNEFGSNVASQFQNLVDFASGSGQAALDVINKSINSSEQNLNTIAQKLAEGNKQQIDFAANAGQAAVDVISKSIDIVQKSLDTVSQKFTDTSKQQADSAQKSLETVSTAFAQNNPSNTAVYTNIFPYVAVGAVVILFFMFSTKK